MRGKLPSSIASSILYMDHPRGCGENLRYYLIFYDNLGSPPRMRGKQVLPKTGINNAGITPADAGKTWRMGTAQADLQDHPRGCGENVNNYISMLNNLGSPPRMRGKLNVCNKHGAGHRITPADAGKTHIVFFGRARNKDHPRGCGENPVSEPLFFHLSGSPPRMRGKPIKEYFIQLQRRITPADAGKTYRREMKKKELRDHPRGCGENNGTKSNTMAA